MLEFSLTSVAFFAFFLYHFLHGLGRAQADALGLPVLRSKMAEATALGAALAAGLSVGFYHNKV
jgi:hypothetical protein